jgi:hypothetical protein
MASGATPIGAGGQRRPRSGGLRRLWYVLLFLEVFGVLIPSIYARITPKLFGIPFFYWYQLAYIFFSMFVTAIVYFATLDRPRRDAEAPPAPGATFDPRMN